MTRYLASATRKALLDDLKANGFEFRNEDGTTRLPNHMEIIQNGQDACIYLGHVPIQTGTDEEGNPIMGESSDFCANVTSCEGMTFSTEIDPPETPYNVFA